VVVDKNYGHIGFAAFAIVVRNYEGIVLAACNTIRNVIANSVMAKA
jgi:hypothetical protein